VTNTHVTFAAGALRDKIRGEMTIKRCQQLTTTLLSDLLSAQKSTAEAKLSAQKSTTEAKLTSPAGTPAVSPRHERELTNPEGVRHADEDGGRSPRDRPSSAPPRDRPLNISQLSRCTCGFSSPRERPGLSGDTTPCKVTPVNLYGVVSPESCFDGGGGARGGGGAGGIGGVVPCGSKRARLDVEEVVSYERGTPVNAHRGGGAGGGHDDSANMRPANKDPGGQQGCEDKAVASCGALAPHTVELITTLGALSPRGGPVQDPVLTCERPAAAIDPDQQTVRREPSGLCREARGVFLQGAADEQASSAVAPSPPHAVAPSACASDLAGQRAEGGLHGKGGWGGWLVGLLLVGVVRLLLRRRVLRSTSVLLYYSRA
jgi:hypothetical protein